MKILFLFPYPSATAASQRFRFEQYFESLEEQNIQYDLQAFLDEKTWQILYKEGNKTRKVWGIVKGFFRRFFRLFTMRKYDFIFIHREASPIGPPIFEWLIAKVLRKKIIFDFDDAIWLSNTTQSNALVAKIKFHGKTAKICKWAYKVSAGNDYLSEYAQKYNQNVVLNPTTIDTENLHNRVQKQHNKKVVIGWTGSHSTIKYLDFLIPILQDLEQKYEFEFVVIADKAPEFRLKSLHFIQWNKTNEIEDLLKLNIGVMPLTDDKWAKGKCGFKALQYMALGIPALASPIGVNTKIIDDPENGFLVSSPSEWEEALTHLLENENLRKTMGQNARTKIINSYSVLSNKENFLSLFS